MARIVLLDAGPLGLACSRPGVPQVDRCLAWLLAMEGAGVNLYLPGIIDYEVRRELLRLGATSKLRKLDDLGMRYGRLDVTATALEQAAAFWSGVRRRGLPTAGDEDLDADAILAGMAATAGQPGDVVTVATTNLRHLARFPGVDARAWETIT